MLFRSLPSNNTDENGITAYFNIRLRAPPLNDNVTLLISSSDTTEGRITSVSGATSPPDNESQLIFTTENWNAWRTVTLTGQWDNISDSDQYYAVYITVDNNTTKDPRYKYLDPPDVSLTNLDLTDKGTFYVSQITGDTDENGQIGRAHV